MLKFLRKIFFNRKREHNWQEIRYLPLWAQKSLPRDLTKLYNKCYIIKGKTFIYKYINLLGNRQGEYTERYYRKLRR